MHLDNSPEGSNGIMFLPFLCGAGYPDWIPEAKGVFAGLKASNNKSDLIRAVMEGITFESRDMFESMKKSGIEFKSLTITGGATNSSIWRQIIADLFNMEIKYLKIADVALMGAIILAGVGAGVYSDTLEGKDKVTKSFNIIEPVSENVKKYDRLYNVYREMCNLFGDSGIYNKL